MSGDSGNGKTFTASRVIEQLITNKPSASGSERAVAYFFCRKGPSERNSVTLALKTMAYDIAFSDQLFAKHLSDLIKDRGLQLGRAASIISAAAASSDPVELAEATNNTTAATMASTAANLDSTTARIDSMLSRADHPLSNQLSGPTPDSTEAVDITLEPKLQRVSTAILQDKPLDDTYEESTVWDVQRHWENLFALRPQSFERHVYLVIDGLDECDETEAIALCAAINVSAGAAESRVTTKVHVLLLMNADRATMFKSHALTAATIVQINPDKIMSDINTFVRERISSQWKQKLVRRGLREDVRQAVLENCSVNFLKASLLVNEVTSFTREDVIRDSLSNLPLLAKTVQSTMLLVIKRLANQLNSYDREDFRVSDSLRYIEVFNTQSD